MHKPGAWSEISTRKIADCRIFTVSESERESSSGKSGSFYLVNAPDWVGVIPVVDTPRGRMFVMIRQYRHGTGRLSAEFPGGIVDSGEDPSRAIVRELKEETGYEPEFIVPLGDLSPNPAFMFHRGCTLWTRPRR